MLGTYCLLERVSVGGMAEVFRAKEMPAAEAAPTLAVKRILPHLAEKDEFLQMFVTEAETAIQLEHPNLVETHGFEAVQSSHVIVMEYLDGVDVKSVQHRLAKLRRRMPLNQACHVALQAARGLAYVHDRGVTHCDVSPRNIRLTFDGQTKLIDFGVAKDRDVEDSDQRRRQDGGRGTYAYMSPEQVERSAPVGPHSDVYALGVCLWEMLTGRRYIEAETSVEMLEAVADPEAVAPGTINDSVPEPLDDVVLRALAVDPLDRYPSATPFVEDLAGVVEQSLEPYSKHHLSDSLGSIFADELEAEERKRRRWENLCARADVSEFRSAEATHLSQNEADGCHQSVTVGESCVSDTVDDS